MLRQSPLILVVDDERDPLIFLESLLSSEGFDVAATTSAAGALEFVAEQRPDVVVTDVRMPGMDGMELLSRIKRLAPETRVILYSAYGDWPLFFQALDQGGVDVIPKGASNAEILRIVRNAVQEASS